MSTSDASAPPARKAQPWFVAGDIDGFFGLAVDNLIQFLLILALCQGVLGFSSELLLGRILPGAAVSLLVGSEPDPVLALGEKIFHASGDLRMSRDGYLSCASCHPDGADDGHTWDFTDRGEGRRNTPSLRSGLDGLLHWTGNFDELQDFEQDREDVNTY